MILIKLNVKILNVIFDILCIRLFESLEFSNQDIVLLVLINELLYLEFPIFLKSFLGKLFS